ncbi:MAG: hypothetical protein RL514_1364 [Verrucomicrobiota bacterium]|jgi:hypothetical protein
MTNSQTEVFQIVLLCGVLTAPLLTAYALWRRGQRNWAWVAGCVGAILWIPAFWPPTTKPLMRTGELLLVCGVLTAPLFAAYAVWRDGARIAALLVGCVGALLLISGLNPGLLTRPSVKLKRICAGQLDTLRQAKLNWASKTKQPDTAIPQPSDLTPYLKAYVEDGVMPVCPEGGTYILGAVKERPRCSLPNHNRGRGPTASIFLSSSTDGLLAVSHLGTVNEPPRCSHADKGHALTQAR